MNDATYIFQIYIYGIMGELYINDFIYISIRILKLIQTQIF